MASEEPGDSASVYDSGSEPEFDAMVLSPPPSQNSAACQPNLATSLLQPQALGPATGQTSMASFPAGHSPWVVPKPIRNRPVPVVQQQFATLDMPTLDSLIWSPEVAATAPAVQIAMEQVPPQKTTAATLATATTTATATSTPVMDENPTSENLLLQLLPAEDAADPLAVEVGVVSQQTESTKRTKTREDSPNPTKRSRSEDPHVQTTPPVNMEPLLKAFTEASKAIVEAIDRNSRAIRCQGAALESMAKELQEVNRNLRTQQRRATSPNTRRRSTSPAIKSVVHRPRK